MSLGLDTWTGPSLWTSAARMASQQKREQQPSEVLFGYRVTNPTCFMSIVNNNIFVCHFTASSQIIMQFPPRICSAPNDSRSYWSEHAKLLRDTHDQGEAESEGVAVTFVLLIKIKNWHAAIPRSHLHARMQACTWDDGCDEKVHNGWQGGGKKSPYRATRLWSTRIRGKKCVYSKQSLYGRNSVRAESAALTDVATPTRLCRCTRGVNGSALLYARSPVACIFHG